MAMADGGAVRVTRMRAVERRNQLAHVAASRFHKLGYHGVSLDSVATEVGLTGPAVYRHFRNKQALLAASISSGLDLVEDALLRTTGGTLDELVMAVAEAGLERPDLFVLQRESRYLRPELRAQVDAQFTRIIDGFERRVRRESPGLSEEDARPLVTAATAVLSSPAMTSTVLPRVEYRRELSAAALACLRFDLNAVTKRRAGPTVEEAPPAEAPSRRTDIVDAATDLFFHHGYTGVSLDDIGAAVGIAGPSILHYFETKSDILVAAFDRATDSLLADQGARDTGEPAALTALVDAYVQFCLRNRALVGVYVSDAVNLPPDALEKTRTIIKRDVAQWAALLQAAVPSLDKRQALVRVQAAMAAIHDLVRLGHFASRPRIAEETEALAHVILLR